jgi:hypothetical protein
VVVVVGLVLKMVLVLDLVALVVVALVEVTKVSMRLLVL